MTSMKHPSDGFIDIYLIVPSGLAEHERKLFKSHLANCPSCQERLHRARKFWKYLEENLKKSPSRRDKELAKHLIELNARSESY